MKTNNWEQKIVDKNDELKQWFDMKDYESPTNILLKYRVWILGGHNNEWRIREDVLTGKVILERR